MSSNKCSLPENLQKVVLNLAQTSIKVGLANRAAPKVDVQAFPAELREPRATFVTLELDGHLRGCIGSLSAGRPLAEDVVENAFAAAFRDPRFPPVTEAERERLAIHVSLLTPAEPMNFGSEEDLLGQIVPGVDGLILEDAGRRGTFLPAVWESLPEPWQFLMHLKRKAGLSEHHWSDTVKVWRYRTEVVG